MIVPAGDGAARELGLFPASDFVITTGANADGPIPSARWYFRDETIAVPTRGRAVAGYARGVTVGGDLRQWAASREPGAPPDCPALVWTAAPHVVRGALLDTSGSTLAAVDGPIAFRLAPKIPLNRSYFDSSSAAYLAGRTLKVRGTREGETLVGRTLWPEDFRLARAAADATAAH